MKYIEADIDDYKIAYEIGKKLLASTLSPISDRAKDVLRVILELSGNEFTRMDILRRAKELRIQITANRFTLKKQLDSLEDIGAIENLGRKGKGGAYIYEKKIHSLDELEDITTSIIPTPVELEEKILREEKEINEIFGPE